MAFLSDSGVILVDLPTPFGIAAKLCDGNKVEVFQGTRIEVRVHGLFQVLVTPFAIHVSQQITHDPALWRLDLLAVLDEGAFPDAPQDAAENPASITVGQTDRCDGRAVLFSPFLEPEG